MSYNFDVAAKMTFEREIEHIKNSHPNNLNEQEKVLVNYMTNRIKEIDKVYGEEPKRD